MELPVADDTVGDVNIRLTLYRFMVAVILEPNELIQQKQHIYRSMELKIYYYTTILSKNIHTRSRRKQRAWTVTRMAWIVRFSCK